MAFVNPATGAGQALYERGMSIESYYFGSRYLYLLFSNGTRASVVTVNLSTLAVTYHNLTLPGNTTHAYVAGGYIIGTGPAGVTVSAYSGGPPMSFHLNSTTLLSFGERNGNLSIALGSGGESIESLEVLGGKTSIYWTRFAWATQALDSMTRSCLTGTSTRL
ncbi:hypothetical protein [Thermogymnomonas acidicola]|uniref:hypothetical protein n=1 Tax=Thermogymnomonas acidicola TaxID=399579 RepID=UPI0009466725|nr:hypothetical protein [Thermogymnomonas acidicola]